MTSRCSLRALWAAPRQMAGRKFPLGADVNRNIDGRAQALELFHRSGPVDVSSDQEGALAPFLEIAAQFGGDGGFADALEAEEHHRYASVVAGEFRLHGPHQLGEFSFADRDEMLCGGHAALASVGTPGAGTDLFALGAVLYAGEKILRNGEVDIGFEKRGTDILQRLVDRFLGEFADTAESLGGGLESLGDGLEQGGSPSEKL